MVLATALTRMPRDIFSRLYRISGFRLALQSAGLSVLSAVIVFAIIHHASEATVRAQLDGTITAEKADILSDTVDDHKTLPQSVRDAVSDSIVTFYALTGADGDLLAGNFTVPPGVGAHWHGFRTLTRRDGLALPPHISAIRGVAEKLSNGETLYVAENASSLVALNRLITNAFLAVCGTILLLGMAGGALLARSTLLRVDAISDTSRDIMNGDLSRRIEIDGTGDEFDRLAVSLNTMLARIQALMENIRQVTNDISHDLRSPLGRLREHLEAARVDTNDPALQAVFDEALLQVDTALGIFAAMLRIAEIEAGERRSRFARVDITTLLNNLAETFEIVAEAEGRTFHADIAPELEVLGDSELLIQMFVNVIENAIRHTPLAGRVSLRAGRGKSRDILVVIADHGPGIPAHERRRVMQRFVRLDASRHNPGAGLGLALVGAIVELHSGQISLEDNAPGLSVLIKLGVPA